MKRLPLEQLVHFDHWRNHRSAEEDPLIGEIRAEQGFPAGFQKARRT